MAAKTLKQQRMSALREFLNSREFYDLAQLYRHAPALSPQTVVAAYEDMKAAILNQVDSSR